jgi:two-component system nitrate/nitrite sensor histidine kinase NarX
MSAPPVSVHAARAPTTIDETVEARVLEERARWAMRIHDGLTQTVTSAVLELQTLRARIIADPSGAVASLSAVEAAIRADLRELRQLLFELYEDQRPPEPPLAMFVDELVARWGLPVRVTIEGDPDAVPLIVLEAAHAVIAEALANAAKHAGTPDVSVRIRADADGLRIEVEDHGRGMTDAADDEPHFGLRLMRIRAEDIGGTVEIVSTPGSGTRVVALLPVGGRGEER